MANYFRKNLRYLREKKGLSKNKLGELTGVNQTTIGRWESGEISPTIDNVIDLMSALNIPIDQLGFFLGKDLETNNDNEKTNIIDEMIEKVNFLDIEDKNFLKYYLNEKKKKYILRDELKKMLFKISKELNIDYETVENIFMNYKVKSNELTELNYNNIKKIIINVLEDEKE